MLRAALLCSCVGVIAAAESYFPNVVRTPGELLCGPIAPEQGRTAVMGWHGGRIVTVPEGPGSQAGADLEVRCYDISSEERLHNPLVRRYGFSGFGFNAHGHMHAGNVMYLGGGPGAIAGWPDSISTDIDPNTGRFMTVKWVGSTGIPIPGYNRSASQAPWMAEMWWSYGEVDGLAFLRKRSSASISQDNSTVATWDHLAETGVIGMPFIIGNILLYASDQTGTGVAAYDISDINHPVLLDVLKENNPGGYWPEIYSHYIFFPRRNNEGGPGSQAGYMLVDFADPTDLKVVANVNLEGSNQYVQFQDEFAFMNNYKIDLRTQEVVLTLNTEAVPAPEGHQDIDASQYAMPFGNLVATGGYGALGPGLAIWAHQAEPDTRGPFVAYHIPKAEQTNYSTVCPITVMIHETLRSETINASTVRLLPLPGGEQVDCYMTLSHGGVLTITPKLPLAVNTTYELTFVENGIRDAAGNGMQPYSFRFSTGNSLGGGNQPPVIAAFTASQGQVAPGTSVTFSVTASDPETSALSYRFDPGDGRSSSAWQSGSSIAFTYNDEGHHRAQVQVRDAAGGIASQGLTITVAQLPAGPLPLNSGPQWMDEAKRTLWVVHPDGNTLAAVNLDTHTKAWEAACGQDPRGITLGPDGNLWLTNHDQDRVEIRSALDGSAIASIALGTGSTPHSLLPIPGTNDLLVSCPGDGTLRRLSAVSRTQLFSLKLGDTAQAVAITGDGTRALVTRFISGPYEGTVWDVSLAGSTLSLSKSIRLARDTGRDSSASGRGVPNYLAGITIEPGGERAWVVGKKDNTERGALFVNTPLTSDLTVRAVLCVIDLASAQELRALRTDLDNSASPSAVVFSPLADWAFIALQGNNQVALFDRLDFLRPESARIMTKRLLVGLSPQGLRLDGTGQFLWSMDFLARGLTATDLSGLFASGALSLPHSFIPTQATELLSAEQLLGKQIFYNAGDPRMSAEGYMSCASCHIDGGHDGRVWDFTQRGEGLRNTTDLRGRSGMGHGLVHWSANFDEIQDFENDIRNGFGGTGFLSDALFASSEDPLGMPKAGLSPELDALAAYVSSLRAASIPPAPTRSADGSRSPAAEAGAALFTSQGCAACHLPAAGFTDRQRHDVGTIRGTSGQRLGNTLDGIDTPTLLGMHAGAPFLHDGSAETLAEVFTAAGGLTFQCENALPNGGAELGPPSWVANQQWHGTGYVSLKATGQTLTLSNMDGGSGGLGQLHLRWCASYGSGTLRLSVNGQAQDIPLYAVINDPSFVPTEWRTSVVPLTLNPGTQNTLVFSWVKGQIHLDDITLANQAVLEKAAVHRRVSSLSAAEQENLLAYVLSLDARDVGPTRRIRMTKVSGQAWTIDPSSPGMHSSTRSSFDELPAGIRHQLRLDPHSLGDG